MKALIRLLEDREHKVGAEIGVFEGDNSISLIENLPGLMTLCCVDPFKMYPEFKKSLYKQGKVFKADYKEVAKKFKSRIQALDVIFVDNWREPCQPALDYEPDKRLVQAWKHFSIDVAPLYPDEFFDFVFIDGNHAYEFIKADIEAWLPKVKIGGMLAGHDWIHKPKYGIIRAVKEIFGDKAKGNKRTKLWHFIKE